MGYTLKDLGHSINICDGKNNKNVGWSWIVNNPPLDNDNKKLSWFGFDDLKNAWGNPYADGSGNPEYLYETELFEYGQPENNINDGYMSRIMIEMGWYPGETYHDYISAAEAVYSSACDGVTDLDSLRIIARHNCVDWPSRSVIVTRHSALVEVLQADGVAPMDCRIVFHATPEDVQDRIVYGVLPLYLASLARNIVEVTLVIPAELRGKELSVNQIRTYMKGINTYKVISE